jgi:nucleoside-diphosphate-sugar epimerase
MKTLITGATGYIGTHLTLALATQGIQVKALVRSESNCQQLMNHPEIELVRGDVTNIDSLKRAVDGCKAIFHLAAFAGIWTKDANRYHLVNVEGTKNLMSAATRSGVQKVVITSTAGVMGPAPVKGLAVDEETTKEPVLYSRYDQSKLEQEKTALSYLNKDIEIVIVNPSRIYGPGLWGVSNSISHLVGLFNQGKWRFIPGNGRSMGNYVYIDDVVHGHILAMQKGRSGQRYILGGENISYNDFFTLLNKLTSRNIKLFKIPIAILLIWSYLEILKANLTSKSPMIVPAFVRKLTHNWNLSNDKAIRELGYHYLDLETGLVKTINWINHE